MNTDFLLRGGNCYPSNGKSGESGKSGLGTYIDNDNNNEKKRRILLITLTILNGLPKNGIYFCGQTRPRKTLPAQAVHKRRTTRHVRHSQTR